MSDKEMTTLCGQIMIAIVLDRSTSPLGVDAAATTVRGLLEKIGKTSAEVAVEDTGAKLIVSASGQVTLIASRRDDDGKGPHLFPPISGS